MALVVLVLVAAVAVGRAAGGKWGLREPRMRGWPLLLAAVLAQAGGALAGVAGYRTGLAISVLLAGAFLGWNRRLPGVPLLAAGLLLNALVVAANGAMPVSRYAAARAGVAVRAAAPPGDPRHRMADAATRLTALGDVVPVALPPRREVVSLGDCLLAAGLALLVVRGLRPREKVFRSRRARRRGASSGRRDLDGEGLAQAQGSEKEEGQSWSPT